MNKFSEGEWKVVHELNVECGRRSVATCGFNSSDQSEMAKSKWNAKLISAAPNLLECLNQLLYVAEEVITESHPLHIKCKEAIKKATE